MRVAAWRVKALAAVVLLSWALPVAGQVVVERLPAGRAYDGWTTPGTEDVVLVVGVPGERSRLAFAPKAPKTSGGFEVFVLQAGEPTRRFVGGPKKKQKLGKVTFGADGAVAVLIRSLGEPGAYRVRATSRLPKGHSRPAVQFTPSSELVPDGPGMLDVETTLRRGLELRVRLRYPAYDDGLGAEHSPEFVTTWLCCALPPQALPLAIPLKPRPKSVLHRYEPYSLATVAFSTEKGPIRSAKARVRRVPAFKPKKGDDVACLPPPRYVFDEHLDAFEAMPGDTLRFDAVVAPLACTEPVIKTLRLWLTSPHGSASLPAGLDLTGSLMVVLEPGQAPISLEFDLPGDVEPGLYAVQLQLGKPDVADFCGDRLVPGAGSLLLRIHEP